MEVSAKELVYAAALTGATHIWGMVDPFYGESPADVKKQVSDLQKGLVTKGYARAGFEDSFQLTEECESLVSDCCLCDQLFSLEILQSSVEPRRLICYRKGERLCLLQQTGGKVLLEQVPGEVLLEKYQEMLSLEEREKGVSAEGAIPFKLLEEAKATGNREKAVELLVKQGVCKELAEIIGETVIGRVRTIRIYLQDVSSRNRDDLQMVWTEKAILTITEDIQQPEETWNLRTTSREEILQVLSDRCGKLLQKTEVEA